MRGRFRGSQSDGASWFSRQWHSIKSSVQTIAELNERLAEIERIALSHSSEGPDISDLDTRPGKSYIDCVIVSHEFTDHCNKCTLLELDRGTPIIATKNAADLIRSWKYFDVVLETPSFSEKEKDWRRTSRHPLPSWLGISRIFTQSDVLYYHSAILVTFSQLPMSQKQSTRTVTAADAIIYTPHGIHAPDLCHLPSAIPPVRTLALLHGLHDIKISVKQLNLGAHNGLQAQRICGAKYWISTHDEIKPGTGVVTPFLHRKVLTLQEALEEERRVKGSISDESELSGMRGVYFAELANGESILLE